MSWAEAALRAASHPWLGRIPWALWAVQQKTPDGVARHASGSAFALGHLAVLVADGSAERNGQVDDGRLQKDGSCRSHACGPLVGAFPCLSAQLQRDVGLPYDVDPQSASPRTSYGDRARAVASMDGDASSPRVGRGSRPMPASLTMIPLPIHASSWGQRRGADGHGRDAWLDLDQREAEVAVDHQRPCCSVRPGPDAAGMLGGAEDRPTLATAYDSPAREAV
jgi:hypothetical protein